ncbi:MAG: helix-turn-helix transcriptional regulator [Pseudoflavonifractor sp.]|nr:helix-turn-helix transcriptional regulator [Pseudoflavonifractor sp.]
MFYERFLKMCQQAGVAPSAVVQALGLGKSNVTYWKKGSTPKVSTIKKIADYFGVTVAYLNGDDDFPYPDLTGQTMTFHPTTPEESATVEKFFNMLLDLSDGDKDAVFRILKSLSEKPQAPAAPKDPPSPDK